MQGIAHLEVYSIMAQTFSTIMISGQSYKYFMLVNYNFRAVITNNLLILTTLEW